MAHTRTYVLTATITFSNINFRFCVAYTVLWQRAGNRYTLHTGCNVVCPKRRHFRNRIHEYGASQVSARAALPWTDCFARTCCMHFPISKWLNATRMRLGHKCRWCAAHTGPCSCAALRRSLDNFFVREMWNKTATEQWSFLGNQITNKTKSHRSINFNRIKLISSAYLFDFGEHKWTMGACWSWPQDINCHFVALSIWFFLFFFYFSQWLVQESIMGARQLILTTVEEEEKTNFAPTNDYNV